jgi:hypothetical protein
MLWNTVAQTVELGWDFYVPVILFVALIALAVPVWAAIGSLCDFDAADVGRSAAEPCRRTPCLPASTPLR